MQKITNPSNMGQPINVSKTGRDPKHKRKGKKK